jgi:N-acetylmuramoyl-L-alanine amidase
MFERGWALGVAGAVVVFAGCKTYAPAPFETAIVEEPIELMPAAPLNAVTRMPSSARGNPHAWPPEWVNTWIPLENWGRFNGLEPSRLIGSNPHPTYELRTATGPLAIKVGTRNARFRGQDWWLGFAPRMIQGVPCLHWLDAQKNLQPLLNAPGNYRYGNRTIVIDPGHGGTDSGAISVYNGAFEKTYTLDWALRLSRLLTSNGWNVILTRDRDTEVSLLQRVTIAERASAALFISLHFNSGSSNRQLAGIETYCLTPVGMPSSLVREFEDDVDQFFPNNAFDEQNLHLALGLHRNLLQSTAAVDRGVRRARFMGVLRGQNRPAVLIEGGYLTNPAEAQNIAEPGYRSRLATAVADALGSVGLN